MSGFFHHDITFALPHGTPHDVVDLLFFDSAGKRRGTAALLFGKEFGLQVVADVFGYGIFGILLHTRIDGGIDFQAVRINIVFASVSLSVFFAPTVQRVRCPRQ